jgi:ER-bound oxygenase mpaB/B'/Rubber oxygenase, catalytic domain
MTFTNQFLDAQRLIGDPEADQLISEIFTTGKQTILYQVLKLDAKDYHAQSNSSIKNFLTSRKENPSWFNSKRLQNGQLLFKHYALEMMALLGAMSLPYCYAASPGNKALYLSDKMRNSPGKRLVDTATFVIEVLTPGSLNDGGMGSLHINKVRLIHALSRYYLKKQSQWDMKWGQPINQEDMAGTNLAFSYIILLGLQQSGYVLSVSEKEDFLFTWRYIGYLLNINENLLPTTLSQAQHLESIIKKRNFKKTEEGKTLTRELLEYYRTNVRGWQKELITSQIRFYIGNDVADYLGMAVDPIKDRIASSTTTFKSLQNMFSIKSSSYQAMLLQHEQLKKSFSTS